MHTNPGYGDDNQIRTALIDRYRKMTHFEIVVAPSSRVMTSVIQERYLDRSIRRLNGAQNTLLVTNKSDVSHLHSRASCITDSISVATGKRDQKKLEYARRSALPRTQKSFG
jgi:regulatory protein YycH of two-component signal transduction system YycFG